MITSFLDKRTAAVFQGLKPKRFPDDVFEAATRKLRLIHRAQDLNDLRVPPGNRPEALKGDRAGQHSIRINDPWRIRFRWIDGGAADVEIVDCH